MRCDRCQRGAAALTGSYFNEEMICLACEQREQEHPQFEAARQADEEAIRRGDFNFPGVGKPADL